MVFAFWQFGARGTFVMLQEQLQGEHKLRPTDGCSCMF